MIVTLAIASQPSASSAFSKSKLYRIIVQNADGKNVKMKQYKGKVLLIVNTATRCGFTPQYKELEAMYENYHAQGLEILDFPCNQFGEQAPGTIAEIRSFCTSNYNTQFEQFAKIDVNGANASPLYVWLKSKKPANIKWNFTKFLINRNGEVVERFEPGDSMTKVENAIKEEL